MYPVLKIMHMLNFLDTFSMGITVLHTPNKIECSGNIKCLTKRSDISIKKSKLALLKIDLKRSIGTFVYSV